MHAMSRSINGYNSLVIGENRNHRTEKKNRTQVNPESFFHASLE